MPQAVPWLFVFCATVAAAADPNGRDSRTVAERLGYPADAKLLIIHADDAGMSHSANLGTIKGMTEGVVNSASVMVPCPWFPAIAAYYREHPEMDFGLHLTLTAEWKHFRWRSVVPHDEVPGLHDEDGFMWRAVADVAGHATGQEVEAELRAQVQRALDFGIKPTHVDTHMGTVFARPDFFQAYRKVANEFGLPYLLPRITPELQQRLSPAMRAVAGMINKTLTEAGEVTLDHLIQISGSHDEASQRKFYLDALRTLKPGITQIIIHCGMHDDELRAVTNSARRRHLDAEIFCSPEVRDILREENIRLITWREIGERQRKLRASLESDTRPAPIGSDDNVRNPQAVQEVLDGTRTVANAAWWGFDPEDATDALQAAIRSGARRVIVPNMTRDWIVRPITLTGNQELVLEDGVVVAAKRGEYRGGGDSVFTGRHISNLTIRGYGATVRMNKEDYISGRVLKDLGWHRWFGQYEKAEWRMALSLRGCASVQVLGLTLRDSGGDGIYLDGGGEHHSRNILLRDVVCDNNYRQGISIIDADGLTVENCVFKNTWGTPPSSGVDFEPDGADQFVRNVVFRNCLFENNYGDGIEVFLSHQKRTSADVSIRFENCRITSRWGTGIRVTKIHDDGPQGLIEFHDCVVEGTEGYGIKVQDKAADRARVRFVNCTVRNAANNRSFNDEWVPIWLMHYRPKRVARFGGIDFVHCHVDDDHDRPAITFGGDGAASGLHGVTGTITVHNPYGIEAKLPPKRQDFTLEIRAAAW